MGCEKAILDVHSRRQRQLGDAPQNHRLVGGLLGIAGKEHDPAGVERAVNVIVSTMYIERMLGKRPRRNLEHHCRKLSGGMVVLLHAVNDALAGGEIHRSLTRNGIGYCATLGRVLSLTFDGDLGFAKNAQLALGVGLLIHLAHLCRWGDRVKNAAICDACLGVISNELVAIGGDSFAGIGRYVRLG